MNTKNIALCLGRAARLPRAWPGTERGESVGPHTQAHPNPQPENSKTCPGPRKNGHTTQTSPGTERGVDKTKTRRNTPKPAQETPQTQKPINKKAPDLENQKNGSLSGAAAVRKSAVHGCASGFVYVTLDPPVQRR